MKRADHRARMRADVEALRAGKARPYPQVVAHDEAIDRYLNAVALLMESARTFVPVPALPANMTFWELESAVRRVSFLLQADPADLIP